MNFYRIYFLFLSLIITSGLCSANCPNKIENYVINFKITNGTGVFAKKGSFTFRPKAKSYKVISTSREVVNSTGTYSFVKKSENVGHMIANDSSAGVSISHEMVFHSVKGGMYTHSNALGSQTGLFEIVKSPNKENQEASKNQLKIYTGTGTIIKGGYIVTCEHVVSKAKKIVFYYKNNEYEARIEHSDSEKDFAILSISNNCPAFTTGLEIKFDDKLRVGEKVFTLGYPETGILGKELKHTAGEISSLTGFKNNQRTMQVSIPSAGGNSGGMILSENGLLAGILVAGVDRLDNVTYGLKIDFFKEKLNSLSNFSEAKINPYNDLSKPDLIDKIRNNVVLLKVITK